jgi:hypothetical protein
LAGGASSPLSSPTASRMEGAGNMQSRTDNWGPFEGSAMTSATPGQGCLDWIFLTLAQGTRWSVRKANGPIFLNGSK